MSCHVRVASCRKIRLLTSDAYAVDVWTCFVHGRDTVIYRRAALVERSFLPLLIFDAENKRSCEKKLQNTENLEYHINKFLR